MTYALEVAGGVTPPRAPFSAPKRLVLFWFWLRREPLKYATYEPSSLHRHHALPPIIHQPCHPISPLILLLPFSSSTGQSLYQNEFKRNTLRGFQQKINKK